MSTNALVNDSSGEHCFADGKCKSSDGFCRALRAPLRPCWFRRHGIVTQLDRCACIAADEDVREALHSVEGWGRGKRDVDGVPHVFVAARFPTTGPPKGVVRMMVPLPQLATVVEETRLTIVRFGAVALSVGVLLSLAGAVGVSRPIRRIMSTVEAFAQGEFSQVAKVETFDELAELARSLSELAVNLRSRLLAAGAEGATWAAIADELPVALVLYDGEGVPLIYNTGTRELLDLSPNDEMDKLMDLYRIPEVQEAVQGMLIDFQRRQLVAEVPWLPDQPVRIHVVCVYAEDGKPRPALILDGEGRERRYRETLRALRTLDEEVRTLASRGKLPLEREELRAALDASGIVLGAIAPSTGVTEVRRLGDVCAELESELAAFYPHGSRVVQFVVTDRSLALADSEGVLRSALRRLLRSGLDALAFGGRLEVTTEVEASEVRISFPREVPDRLIVELGSSVGPVGGRIGVTRSELGARTVLQWPRA